MVALVCCSDIQLCLHRFRSLAPLHLDTGETSNHFTGRLGSHGLDLLLSGAYRVTELALGGFNLGIDRLGCDLDTSFGLTATFRLGFLREARGIGSRGV